MSAEMDSLSRPSGFGSRNSTKKDVSEKSCDTNVAVSHTLV